MKESIEQWKELQGFDYPYQVSSLGKIKTPEMVDTRGYKRKERIRYGTVNSRGYLGTSLTRNGKGRMLTIHSLVAEAFLGHKRDGLYSTGVVNHIDEDKTNNRLSNLEVITQRQNLIHSRTKLRKNGLPANIHMNGLKYRVRIGHGNTNKVKEGKGCHIYLGNHETVEEAVKVRDQYLHELENCEFQHLIIE